MTEKKDFQPKFTNWIKEHPRRETTVFELKLEKSKSMRFDKVKKHQIEALWNASHFGMYHKINDLPIYKESKTRFANPKPFDCFWISYAVSYIAIWFYKPRQKREMLWIDISDFIGLKNEYEAKGRKSLKESEWKENAHRIYQF